jgi:hypothetical protein
MTNPNSLVSGAGQKVDLNRLTSAVYDEWEDIDEDASTFETVQIDAWVSNVSEEIKRRVEGHVENPALQITVDSSTDISADRNGRPDRVRYDGRIYEVAEVIRIDHPLADAEKLTAVLTSAPGRAGLDTI